MSRALLGAMRSFREVVSRSVVPVSTISRSSPKAQFGRELNGAVELYDLDIAVRSCNAVGPWGIWWRRAHAVGYPHEPLGAATTACIAQAKSRSSIRRFGF